MISNYLTTPIKTIFVSFYLLCINFISIDAYQDVYGNKLSSCSEPGMALTGYTRTGYCVDQDDDHGSHHICINLSSVSGGNFCDVTGQSDWCSSYMQCHPSSNGNDDYSGDDDSGTCQVQNWCVCQWAFASYIENAGGCDYIQDIQCDAINIQSVKAYTQNSSSEKYQAALSCLEKKCGFSSTSSTYRI